MERYREMEWKPSLRVRVLLDRWLPVLLLVGVVGVVVFGWLAATTFVVPGTHTETRTTYAWTTDGEFDHGATVTGENSVFPVGTTVENRAVYYQSIMPTATGTFQYRYRLPGSGGLTVDPTLSVVIRSTGQEEGQVYWRVSRTLIDATAREVGPGEAVTVDFTVNVTELQQRLESIRSDLGETPGTVSTAIVATVDVSGQVQGHAVDRTETYRLPITVQGSTYKFGTTGTGNKYVQREQVTVPNEYGPLRRIGSIIGLVASLTILLGAGYARVTGLGSVTSEEREQFEYSQAREEYEDWITAVELPEDTATSDVARACSLEGLVDLAIDTDERVLEDTNAGRYVVQHDGTTFVYEPPGSLSDT